MMNDLLVEGLTILSHWYTGFFLGYLGDVLVWVMDIFFFKIILEIIFNIFPFVKRIANFLFMPFNIFHQWTHMHKAKQINEKAIRKRLMEVEQEELRPTERFFSSKIIVKPTFSLGIGDRENTGVIILPTEELTLKETMGLAYAPVKYGIVISLLSVLTGPLITVHPIYSLIHMYIFLGAILYLFPSQEDYRFIINSIMTSSTVSPMYFLHTLVVFIVSSVTQMYFYDQIGYPPYWYIDTLKLALSVTVIYIAGLITVIGFLSPDITLKTQKRSTFLSSQVQSMKRYQREQNQLAEHSRRQTEDILEAILTEEETFFE